jgi:hypothetical protein
VLANIISSDATEFQKYMSKADAGEADTTDETDPQTVDMLEKSEREDEMRRRFGAPSAKPSQPAKKPEASKKKEKDMFDVSFPLFFHPYLHTSDILKAF